MTLQEAMAHNEGFWDGDKARIMFRGYWTHVATGSAESCVLTREAAMCGVTAAEAPAVDAPTKPKRQRKPAESPVDLDFDDI